MGRLKTMPARIAALPPKVAALPKIADRFYQSREWLALVAWIKAQRGAWCEDCGAGGRIYGDHVIELKDGGAPLDEENVRLRCHRCHARKTAAARARRAAGKAEGGGQKSGRPDPY